MEERGCGGRRSSLFVVVLFFGSAHRVSPSVSYLDMIQFQALFLAFQRNSLTCFGVFLPRFG